MRLIVYQRMALAAFVQVRRCERTRRLEARRPERFFFRARLKGNRNDENKEHSDYDAHEDNYSLPTCAKKLRQKQILRDSM